MTKKNKYTLEMSSRYRKGLRKMLRRGADENKIIKAVNILLSGTPLPPVYEDHPLHGKFKGFRECHIESDWLLVYQIIEDTLILSLIRTGTHDEVFKD
ncbi:MAG: type II toxin-antitoxin system YafQ family toxin [Synergistaceae bacterium]|nr:type II toxin-antitoxin system YafQ family toxin [Synergistaceae bacterium]